jgi:hypothetical protein
MQRSLAAALLVLTSLTATAVEPAASGLKIRESPYPVAETLAKIEGALAAVGGLIESAIQ